MSQEKKGRITIANLIALTGLAGLGVVMFFGILLHSSDGKPGIAILGAFAFIVVLGFLLFMSIKAKGAENDVKSWRYVEWTCLLVYVVVAILFAAPFQRFFYVVSQKENLQEKARNEVKAIKTLYKNYEHQQKKYLTDAVEQLQNYLASGQQRTVKDDLSEYVEGIGSDINSWAAKASKIVALPKDKQLLEIESREDRWNFMQVASLAADLEEKENSAWTSVQKKILKYQENNRLIPVIGGGGLHPYRLDGYAKFDLGTKPDATFAKELRKAEGSTALGWILYVVLNGMILLNYLVASRSSYVGPRSNRQTCGLSL